MPSPYNAGPNISRKVYDYLEYINDIIFDARYKTRFVFNFEITDESYKAVTHCIPQLKKYYKGASFTHYYQPSSTNLPVQKCHKLIIQIKHNAKLR